MQGGVEISMVSPFPLLVVYLPLPSDWFPLSSAESPTHSTWAYFDLRGGERL